MSNKLSFNKFKMFFSKHEPETLMVAGIAGLVFCIVDGIIITNKVSKILEHKKEVENKEKLTFKEVVKESWKHYIPIAVTAPLSIACIVKGNSVSNKRSAALAAAYTIAETTLDEYKGKLCEELGEKKARSIADKVCEEKILKDPPTPSTNVIFTGEGDSMFYDPLSGRYFKSTVIKIEKAGIELGDSMIRSTFGSVSLNDLYDAIGLEHTDMGDLLGWDMNTGVIKISVSHHRTQFTPDGVPCGVIYYEKEPVLL